MEVRTDTTAWTDTGPPSTGARARACSAPYEECLDLAVLDHLIEATPNLVAERRALRSAHCLAKRPASTMKKAA